MFVRVVTSKQKHGTYRSVQIVESYRDPKKSEYPITRIIAHLGQVCCLPDYPGVKRRDYADRRKALHGAGL